MAWCPICNTEYEKDGICPTCNSELLQGNPDDYTDIFTFEGEEITLSIYNHLLEIGFETVWYYFDEEAYHILCENFEAENAKKQLVLYMNEDYDGEISPSERIAVSKITDGIINEAAQSKKTQSFVSAKEKYANTSSSAVSLLVVGAIGILILLADISGIFRFPFSGSSRTLFLTSMGCLFVLFIVMGILSLRKAKQLSALINEETSLKEEIRTFITEELDLSPADDDLAEDVSPEEKYLARMDYITAATGKQFPDADILFIETVTEELYDTLFSD